MAVGEPVGSLEGRAVGTKLGAVGDIDGTCDGAVGPAVGAWG